MKIHIEENDKPLTKEQVELLTKNEPTTSNFKLIFGPSKLIKIKGIWIWRRINLKGELKK